MNLPKVVGGKRLRCLSLSVNQSITPLSNATMEVLKEDELPVRTFVEISTPNGITEVYRTRQPQSNKESGTVTIQLDHAICEIGDYLTSASANQEMTLADAIYDIFSYYDGTHWQLATITANNTVTVDYDHDNVLEQLLAVMAQVPQYYLSFDFSTTPWTLDIEEKDNTVTGEGRMSRNLAAASVKEDDKDLCTRVYVKGLPKPSGREDEEDAIGYMDADTISLYGVIEKDASNGDLTQAQATRLATAYLNAHKHPRMSVELDGYDLSEITGENFDKFITGKKFRLAVPEDNLVIEDYITKISWADPLNTPQANVIIGDEIDATINFIQDQISNAKSSKRGKRKTDKKVEGLGHLIEETDSYWRSTYWDTINSLRGTIEQTAEHWSSTYEDFANCLRGEVRQTASYWRSTYEDFSNSLRGVVEQTASYWKSTYEDFANCLRGEVEQTASYWRSTYEDFENSTRTIVEQSNSYWRTALSAVMSNGKVTAASIATAINAQGAAGVAISGDWIKIDGNTTLTGKLAIENGSLRVKGSELIDGSLTVRGANGGGGGSVTSTNYTVYAGGSITFNGASYGQSWTLDSTALVGLLKAVQIVQGSSANTYKLQYKTFTATDWVDAGSFSRATALSGTWSGGKITMSANDSNVPNLIQEIRGGDPSWSSNTATVKVYAYTNNGQLIGETGRSITVDATARYKAGWDYGITQKVRTSNNATSQELTTKTLTAGQRWTITDTYTKSNGATEVIKYTVAAPSQVDPTITAVWVQSNPQSSANPYNKYVIRKDGAEISGLTITVTAGASISYNSSTHKYTATGTASAGGSQRGSATATSGTEAYNAGVDVGFSNGVASSWFVYTQSTYNDQGQLAANSRLAIGYTDGSGSWHTRATWSTPGGGGGGGGAIESIVDVYPVDDNDVQISQDTTISSAINIRACATYTTSDSQILQYRYGSNRVKITPDKGTRFRLECTGKQQTYPGSSLYNFTFTLNGAGNSFNTGTTYDFYH